jgi:hypothetical protein
VVYCGCLSSLYLLCTMLPCPWIINSVLPSRFSLTCIYYFRCYMLTIFRYRVVTSARSCNKVGHLFWFTILAQHEANDVILYIYNVYRRRSSFFLKHEDYKMRLKQVRLNWTNTTQVKKLFFTNILFTWSFCLWNLF